MITIFIFGLGILLGVFIEDLRMGDISSKYLQSEINLLDLQILSEIINTENIDCEVAAQENIRFGDKIYEDALMLEKYETASRLKDNLIEQHRRYDLLRTVFWINSIELKDRCHDKFNTVVYLYKYQEDTPEEKQKQAVFSNFLQNIKSKYQEEIILIPIAIDLDLSSLNILIERYNITQTTILVNEDIKIDSIDALKNLEISLD